MAARPRLGLAVDDFEPQPGFGATRAMKAGAIGGHAAGLGGHQPHPLHVAPLELVGADPQGIDGAVHGLVAEFAGLRQPLAQPDDARKGIDDREAAPAGVAISKRQLLVPRSSAP